MKAFKIGLIILAMLVGACGVTTLIRNMVGYYALENLKKTTDQEIKNKNPLREKNQVNSLQARAGLITTK